MTNARVKVGRPRAKDSGDKSQDCKDSSERKCFYCDRAGHVKSDCQQRAEDMRQATAAGRPFVDKSKKVSALCNTARLNMRTAFGRFVIMMSVIQSVHVV